uniref:ATPase H+ transporting accessory protein 1 n=1 Tax=Oncorhynchus kisutch TaxID=8019 RepID=A0A8C7HRH8_ONCKI
CWSRHVLLVFSVEVPVALCLVVPAAGHIVGVTQLSSYLETALGSAPRNVLLFLQDKMSIEDFTMYGGAFGNKQDSAFPNLEGALLSSPSPLVLPTVAWQASNAVIGQLQDQLDTSPLYMDPEMLSQLRLNASSPALLVFRLPYSTGYSSDSVIGQVMNIMKSQSVPYTAVYTAVRPSRVSVFTWRSLLQDEDLFLISSPQEGGAGCIMLWAENLTVSVLRGGRWERHDLTSLTFGEGVTPRLQGSLCNQSHSSLVLNYENILGQPFLQTIRHYKVSARRWFTLDAVEIEYDGQKATFNGSRNVYAPAEYSYRCQSVTNFRYPLLVPRTSKDPANQWRVSFTDFQIQGFNVAGGEFSYASDCAGFFSPGIWMGLLTSLLMLMILTYGLHMIMQLHTMDRFDDPKGPAISVPQTD